VFVGSDFVFLLLAVWDIFRAYNALPPILALPVVNEVLLRDLPAGNTGPGGPQADEGQNFVPNLDAQNAEAREQRPDDGTPEAPLRNDSAPAASTSDSTAKHQPSSSSNSDSTAISVPAGQVATVHSIVVQVALGSSESSVASPATTQPPPRTPVAASPPPPQPVEASRVPSGSAAVRKYLAARAAAALANEEDEEDDDDENDDEDEMLLSKFRPA
jgi:hypothetical protein